MSLFDTEDLCETLADREPLILKIMAEIEGCRSSEAVEMVARRYAKALSEMNASQNPDVRTRAIHVKNLGKYQRLKIARRWLDD